MAKYKKTTTEEIEIEPRELEAILQTVAATIASSEKCPLDGAMIEFVELGRMPMESMRRPGPPDPRTVSFINEVMAQARAAAEAALAAREQAEAAREAAAKEANKEGVQ